MASSTSSTPQTGSKRPTFIATALKNKQSYYQFFAMTGIFLLSMRSLTQKYRIHDLQDDTAALQDEHSSNLKRFNQIRQDLLDEAQVDTTGRFGALLRTLFADQSFE